MRKVYTHECSNLYFCNQEEYEDFIANNDCWCTWFLLCAKNPFHKDIVGYDRNCPKDHKEYLYAYRPMQHLMALNMIDAPTPNFFADKMIDEGLSFIGDSLCNGNDVIVVCNQGESRSPTMCLMFMMAMKQFPYNNSWGQVAKKFLEIAPEWMPNAGISEYARMFWERERKKHEG